MQKRKINENYSDLRHVTIAQKLGIREYVHISTILLLLFGSTSTVSYRQNPYLKQHPDFEPRPFNTAVAHAIWKHFNVFHKKSQHARFDSPGRFRVRKLPRVPCKQRVSTWTHARYSLVEKYPFAEPTW